MNLLLRPAPFNPTPYLPRFRLDRADIKGTPDDGDDEIIPIIVAIHKRKSQP